MNTLENWATRWNIPAAALQDLATLYHPEPTGTPATSEAATSKETERLSGTYRQRLWRNNSGACQDDEGRQVRYGLGNTSSRINAVMKSSDYIGITTITVTPGMVGRRLGIFTALEFKKPDWHLTKGDKRGQAQAAFLAVVEGAGGIGSFITDAGQYVELLRRWGVLA